MRRQLIIPLFIIFYSAFTHAFWEVTKANYTHNSIDVRYLTQNEFLKSGFQYIFPRSQLNDEDFIAVKASYIINAEMNDSTINRFYNERTLEDVLSADQIHCNSSFTGCYMVKSAWGIQTSMNMNQKFYEDSNNFPFVYLDSKAPGELSLVISQKIYNISKVFNLGQTVLKFHKLPGSKTLVIAYQAFQLKGPLPVVFPSYILRREFKKEIENALKVVKRIIR